MRWRVIIAVGLACAASAAIAVWVLDASQFGHWFQVHTGIINESGPYYGFWSGFGSDITEFGVLGAVGAGVYQLFKKYNCHEPACWRVGQHSAADGQFLLCYRHHPDYQGRKPTRELIGASPCPKAPYLIRTYGPRLQDQDENALCANAGLRISHRAVSASVLISAAMAG